jgi:HME family heavy-metal exporter
MMGFVTLAGISTRNGILKDPADTSIVAVHEGEIFGPAPRHSRQRRTPRTEHCSFTALSAALALTPLVDRSRRVQARNSSHPMSP